MALVHDCVCKLTSVGHTGVSKIEPISGVSGMRPAVDITLLNRQTSLCGVWTFEMNPAAEKLASSVLNSSVIPQSDA